MGWFFELLTLAIFIGQHAIVHSSKYSWIQHCIVFSVQKLKAIVLLQLAALDFIACATADVFAMTDSGSQLSSLVNGYRIYHGQDQAPTIRPNKKRFARILSENRTIQWHDFRERVRKMVQENQRIIARRKGRSIYRLPRTPGCMCKYWKDELEVLMFSDSMLTHHL